MRARVNLDYSEDNINFAPVFVYFSIMSSTKLLKILILFFGLIFLSEAYALTSTANSATLCDGFNDDTHSTSWTGSHVTFTLSSPDNAMYKVGSVFYLSNGRNGFIPYNEGKTYTFFWQVDYGYDIQISNVTITVIKASGAQSYITVGDGPRNGDLHWVAVANLSTGSHVYTTNESIPIVFEKAFSWSTVNVTSITVTYTLIPLFIYDGSGDGADGDTEHLRWSKADNWLHNVVPTIDNDVFIRHDVVITDEATAKSVTMENPNKLTVAPTGQLTVGTGGVINATTENFTLQAGTSGADKGKTGSLRIDPAYTGAMPSATVEMYSIAYFNMGSDNIAERNNAGSYQYVGSPMKGGASAKSVFEKSWCYNWDEAAGEWKNNRKTLTLQPFEGYATSQYTNPDGLLVTHKGQLASNGNTVLSLSYNGTSTEGGFNALANSYTAPIDITEMATSDFDHAEATIYLFNTGSKNDSADLSTEAGQYISIPVGLASYLGYPTVIPSMQGFFVKASTPGVPGSLTLNYDRMVWNTTCDNMALRAPQREIEDDKRTLCVSLSADGWADRLYLIESEEFSPGFENGYDAHKMMSGNLNIYSIEGTDSLAVDATNSLIGARIGVRTGDEVAYTLVFSHVSSEEELALLDEETSEMIEISEGTEYTFLAEPNSVLDQRFRIIARATAVTTDLDEVGEESKAHKFIRGNQLYILKNGVLYNVMGTIVQK